MSNFDPDREVSTTEKQQTVDKYIALMRERGFPEAAIWADVAVLKEKLALDIDSYDNRVHELNKNHAVIMVGGNCVVMNEVIDPTSGRPDVTFSRLSDFRNFYANVKVPNPTRGKGQPKEVSIAKIWLESPKRRQYGGIHFSPGKDIPGYYNLFRGFSFSPKQGDWSFFKQHVFEIIANRDKRFFDWVIAWMARIVQDPGGERPGTSIVLRGAQGTGKGCFATIFGSIFGCHFLHITSPKHLTGRFNQHLKDCLVAFIDEATWGGDKTTEGVLKGMITEDHFLIEPKGKDVFAVKNHLNIIIASNSSWVVPAGLEERRFFVLDVAEDHIQDLPYFSAIFKQMKNWGKEAMLYDLLRFNIEEFGIDLRTVPRTSALLDQIVKSMSTIAKFWYSRLKEGTLSSIHNEWQENYIYSQKLYDEYVEFTKQIKARPEIKDIFAKELKTLCPEMKKKRITVPGGKRAHVYEFPNLHSCQELFEKTVNMKIDWGEEDEEIPF